MAMQASYNWEKALFGIKDGSERLAYILWCSAVLVSSIVGDSTILIATIKYNAIKHHKMIVAILQHLAVSDLLLTVFRVFPNVLTFITDRWVLGELLCHMSENVGFCNAVTMTLTCLLSTVKLIIVKYPLRARAWSKRAGQKLCIGVWIVIILGVHTPVLAVKLVYKQPTIHFNYFNYQCTYNTSSSSRPTWSHWYEIVSFNLGSIVTYLILLVTSLQLLVTAGGVASRRGETLRWRGLVTVLLTVLVFLVSWVPLTALYLVMGLGLHVHHMTVRAIFYLTYLNIMSNFFVYSISERSFRRFLKTKILKLNYSEETATEQRLTTLQMDQTQSPYPRRAVLQIRSPVPNPRHAIPCTQRQRVSGCFLSPKVELFGPPSCEGKQQVTAF